MSKMPVLRLAANTEIAVAQRRVLEEHIGLAPLMLLHANAIRAYENTFDPNPTIDVETRKQITHEQTLADLRRRAELADAELHTHTAEHNRDLYKMKSRHTLEATEEFKDPKFKSGHINIEARQAKARSSAAEERFKEAVARGEDPDKAAGPDLVDVLTKRVDDLQAEIDDAEAAGKPTEDLRGELRKTLIEQIKREFEAAVPGYKKSAKVLPLSPAKKLAVVTGPRVVLGRELSTGEPFCIADETRSRSLHMIGAPNSGKSMAMFHLLRQDFLNGTGILLLDPHGNHYSSVYALFIRWLAATDAAKKRRIHIFDPEADHVCGLNPVRRPPGCDASVIGSAKSDAIARGFGDEDTTESPTLRRGLRAILTAVAELGLTLLEALMLLERADASGLRAWAIRQLTDENARKFLQRLDELAANPRMAQTFDVETVGILNRLEEFLSSKAIRRVFGQVNGIDLAEVMDGGEVVAANLAGGGQISEREGDLLGRLLISDVLYHAKRRKNNRLFAVWADEGHRFLSGDVPNALEELRKNSVSICIAHQHLSQLGKEGDRIPQAMLTVPQTRLVFALNNIEEAKLIAPEVMKLPHEKVVEALVKPTVIGHEIRLMRNASVGRGTTETTGTGQNSSHTNSVGQTRSDGGSIARGTSKADSKSKTRNTSSSVADGITEGTSTTCSRQDAIGGSDSESITETEGGSDTTSISKSRGNSRARGGSHSDSEGWNQNLNQNTSLANTTEPMTQRWPDQTDSAGSGSGTSGSSSDGENWSKTDNRTETEGTAHTKNWSSAKAKSHTDSWSKTTGLAEAEMHQTSRVVTNGESEAGTIGTTIGVNKTRSKNWSNATQHTHGDVAGSSSSQSKARQATISAGLSESLAPIMANLPTAVHDLGKVTHMAAEFLNELPIGVAAVKTRQGGKVISAVVKFPEPRDYPEAYPGAAKDKLLSQSPLAIPIEVANRNIVDRQDMLKREAAKLRTPKETPEPKTFRTSGARWVNNPDRGGELTDEA